MAEHHLFMTKLAAKQNSLMAKPCFCGECDHQVGQVVGHHTLTSQCDYSNWATWKRVNQSEGYLKTKDSNLFLKLTNNIEE